MSDFCKKFLIFFSAKNPCYFYLKCGSEVNRIREKSVLNFIFYDFCQVKICCEDIPLNQRRLVCVKFSIVQFEMHQLLEVISFLATK